MFRFFRRPERKSDGPGMDARQLAGHVSTMMTIAPDDGGIKFASYGDRVRNGLAANPYVLRAVEIRATGVSQLTPVLYDRDGNPVDPERDRTLGGLLRHPSPGTTWRDLMHTVQVHLAVDGNAYIYISEGSDGSPELRAVPPDHVSYQPSTDVFRPVAYWRISGTSEGMIQVPLDRMIHIHGPVGPDGVTGVSPLEACALSVGAQTEARRWNASLMANGGKPGIILTMPPGTVLTDAERTALMTALKTDHGGTANAGAPIVLEGGMSAQALGATPTDMDYTAGLTLMAREISIAMSVSSELLGDAANKTHANYGEALKDLAVHTIKPLADQVYEALTLALVTDLSGPVASIGYDLSEIDGMQSDEAAIIAAYNSAEFLTVNEKRARLGYEAVPDGDQVMVSMSASPLSEAVSDPMASSADNRGDTGALETWLAGSKR